MELVILESPFAGDIEKNLKYARMAMRDCLMKNEAPMASHLLYTQEGVLIDNIKEERDLGISAGLEWGKVAEKTIVYIDRGISSGMEYGIKRAINDKRKVVFRSIQDFGNKLTIEDCYKKYIGSNLYSCKCK